MKALYHFTFQQPMICTAIHNGHLLRAEIANNIGISDADLLREEDPYTAHFTDIVENYVNVETSRFEVDLNRLRSRAVYLHPEDAWGLTVRRELLTQAEIDESISGYDEFYRRVQILMDEMLKVFPRVFIYDIHSYNHHRQGPDAEFDSEQENPEIILGTNNMLESYFPLVKLIQGQLIKEDYFGRTLDVRVNVKFPGGSFSRWLHSNYGDRVCCLALEFKKIYMDEWTGIVNQEQEDRLKEILSSTLPVIQGWLQD